MAKKVSDIIHNYDIKYGLERFEPCTKEENKIFLQDYKLGKDLPDDIYKHIDELNGKFDNTFFRHSEEELTPQQETKYILYRQLDALNSIKNAVVFLAVVTGLGMICTILLSIK